MYKLLFKRFPLDLITSVTEYTAFISKAFLWISGNSHGILKKAIRMYVSVSFKSFPSMKIQNSRKSTFPEIQRKAIESRDV